MIPAYNATKYLPQAIEGVLAQDPGPEEMQIEVIDDCSTQGDPENVVRRAAGARVTFYRQPINLGLSANWNSCIARARGFLVHILHQDDMVLPGFYTRLGSAFEKVPEIGAAFCRCAFIDEDGLWEFLDRPQRRRPGVLSHWIERIGVTNDVMFPSIVVPRRVYEAVGGFHPRLPFTLDWEMWTRIAARYPVWYDPQPLACYRMHSGSETARIMRSNLALSDELKFLEIAGEHLPPDKRSQIKRVARDLFAMEAIARLRKSGLSWREMVGSGRIREILGCSRSSMVVRACASTVVRSLFSTRPPAARFQPETGDDIEALRLREARGR